MKPYQLLHRMEPATFSVKFIFTTVLLALGVISGLPVQSQTNHGSVIHTRRLSTREGLSSNYVTCLLQDSKGFIWVGTRDGLNKYDGYTFKKYLENISYSKGITRNDISSICEDSSGNIWVGTPGGLAAIDKKTDKITIFRHETGNTPSMAADAVTTIFADSKGQLWVGYENGELDMLVAETKTFHHFGNHFRGTTTFLFTDKIQQIKEREDGLFNITKGPGTIIFNPRDGTFKSNSAIVKDGFIYSRLIVFTDNFNKKSLFWFQDLTDKKEILLQDTSIHLSANKLSDPLELIHIDFNPSLQAIYLGDEKYWLPSTTKGLFEIDFKKNSITPLLVTDGTKSISNIKGAIQARDGAVWFFAPDGLYVAEESPNLFRTYSLREPGSSSAAREVRALFFSKDHTLWASTAFSHGAVFRYDTSILAFRQAIVYSQDSTPPLSVNSIVQDRIGTLWITASGIGSSNSNLYSIKPPYKTAIPCINSMLNTNSYGSMIDSGGLLWLCCSSSKDGSLISIDPLTLELKKYSYADSAYFMQKKTAVWSVLEKDINSLWVATYYGLFLFDKRTGTFGKRYFHKETDPESISHNEVWVLHKDSKGRLWVGTWGGGLNLFNEKSETFTRFTKDDGLPSNRIQSILEDSTHNLWIATTKGISCFNPAEKTFTNYTSADGLMDDEFVPHAAAISPTGEFFFGGTNGVTSFYPEQLKRKSINSPLILTDFKVFDSTWYGEIANGDTISLHYNENYFSVDISYIDFHEPSKKHYEYLLEEYDKKWIRAGERRNISYNRIAPGKYILRVRVYASGDNKIREEISVVIIVSPPFWKTWWFRLAAILLIIVIAGFFIRRRELKRKQFQELLKQATENERLQLAGELHDGPLQDLYGSRFLIEPLLEKPGDPGASKAKELDSLLSKVRGDLRELTGKLQMPGFEAGLGEALRLFCDSFQKKHPSMNIILDIVDEEYPLPANIVHNLFRIFRTAMANIDKHSKATIVNVHFSVSHALLRLIIADNGIGFQAPRNWHSYPRNKHYGIFLMESFAQSIGAKCSIITKPGQGTKIIIELPAFKWRKKNQKPG